MKIKKPTLSYIRFFAVMAIFFFAETSAFGAAIYSYTGNNYDQARGVYDTSMNITGSFTVNAPLINFSGDARSLITSISFFDGFNTLTDADFFETASLTTDSSGNLTEWLIRLASQSDSETLLGQNQHRISITRAGSIYTDIAEIRTCAVLIFGSCSWQSPSLALVNSNPGNWNIVPVPAAAWLFGSGLVGLIGIARRKQA